MNLQYYYSCKGLSNTRIIIIRNSNVLLCTSLNTPFAPGKQERPSHYSDSCFLLQCYLAAGKELVAGSLHNDVKQNINH